MESRFETRHTSPARAHADLEALVARTSEDARLSEEVKAALGDRGRRAAALAHEDAWLAAAELLLEGAELERRATGERGAWWSLWLEVHDAIVAGDLGDWSV